MRQVTNAEAYRAIRIVFDTTTGRLRGQLLRPLSRVHIPAGGLHPDPALLLHEATTRGPGGPIRGDLPFYVVSCDGTPIAWLTHHGHTVAPAADLTPFQRRHQHQAVEALTDVAGVVLSELADARDHREGRTDTTRPDGPGTPMVRVAAVAEPTRTWWTAIDGDYPTTLDAVRRLVGAHAVRVIDTHGFGHWHGNQTGWPPLDMLCALHCVAVAHDVPAGAVGDWLGALPSGGRPSPSEMETRFADAYRGCFADRNAYVAHVLTARGWRQALAVAGIPERYLHWSVLSADVLHAVRVVDLGARAGLAVFTRDTPAT